MLCNNEPLLSEPIETAPLTLMVETCINCEKFSSQSDKLATDLTLESSVLNRISA